MIRKEKRRKIKENIFVLYILKLFLFLRIKQIKFFLWVYFFFVEIKKDMKEKYYCVNYEKLMEAHEKF